MPAAAPLLCALALRRVRRPRLRHTYAVRRQGLVSRSEDWCCVMLWFDGVHLAVDHDNLADLHQAARWCGLPRSAFQPGRGHPHYDVTTGRARARVKQTLGHRRDNLAPVRLLECTPRELVRICYHRDADCRAEVITRCFGSERAATDAIVAQIWGSER